MPRVAPTLLLCLLGATGCHTQPVETDPATQQEAAYLQQAIESLRQAPNSEKAAHLRALEQAACSQPDTCALKGQCVGAYRKFLGALSAIKALEAEPPDLSAGATAPSLATVERDLDAARKKTLECSALQGDLNRRYKL